MLLTLYHESLQKSSQKRSKAQNQQKKSTYPEKKVRAQRKKKRNERKCRHWREAERRGKQMSERVLMLSPAPTSSRGYHCRQPLCRIQSATICNNLQRGVSSIAPRCSEPRDSAMCRNVQECAIQTHFIFFLQHGPRPPPPALPAQLR